MKKTMSIILSVLLLFGTLIFTSNAQMAAFSYVVTNSEGTKISYSASQLAKLSKTRPDGLYIQDGYLVMENYSGKSIQAIANGNIGDDDAPILYIKVIGTCTLTSSLLESGEYGALYAEKRQGGSGNNSAVNVSGTGTLTISNLNARNLTTAKNMTAVCAGEYNQSGAKVVITNTAYSMQSSYHMYGIDADVRVTGSGVLDVKSYANRKTVKVTPGVIIPNSNCRNYGINGDFFANTTGYVSIDTTSKNSGENYCVTGTPVITGTKTALYLKNSPSVKLFSSCDSVTDNNSSYRRLYSADTSSLNYYAYIPFGNAYLTELTLSQAFADYTYPKVGDVCVKETDFTSINDYCYRKVIATKNLRSGGSTLYDFTYEATASYEYRFEFCIIPKVGYCFTTNESNFTGKKISDYQTYKPDKTSNSFSLYPYVTYLYTMPEITQDNDTEYLCENSKYPYLSVEAGEDADTGYQWVLDVMVGDTLFEDLEIPWGDMDGFDGMDTCEMTVGEPCDETDVVYTAGDESTVTVQDADALFFHCKVSSVAGSVDSKKTEWKPYGHFTSLKALDSEYHQIKCACCTYTEGQKESHSFTATTTSSTCTQKGEKVSVCNKCGYNSTVVLPLKEHDIYTVELEKATCTKKGTKQELCKNCSYSKISEIPVKEHTIVNVEAVEAKCETDGYTSGTQCSVCKAYLSGHEKTAMKGHTPEAIAEEAPTCLKQGKTAGVKCSLCQKILVEQESISKAQHTPYSVDEVKATCTKSGTSAGKKCSVCGEVLEGFNTIKAFGHSFDKGTVKEKATCTKTGVRVYSCKNCDTVRTESIPKQSHSYKDYVTAATTKKDGKIENKCTVCGKVNKTTAIYKIKSVKLLKDSVTYTGKAQKIGVAITNSKGKEISTDSYTVTYKNNKNVGKATVTIKFKGNYSGIQEQSFTIAPKGTTIKKASSTEKGKATVKLDKQTTQTTGYEIQYSTDKAFKSAKTMKIAKASTASAEIDKLKSGKTVYFRVRTYKTVSKTQYCSSWSKSTSCKIK